MPNSMNTYKESAISYIEAIVSAAEQQIKQKDARIREIKTKNLELQSDIDKLVDEGMCKGAAIEGYKGQITKLKRDHRCLAQDSVDHLRWIYERLTAVHKVDARVDYMRRFKAIIDALEILKGTEKDEENKREYAHLERSLEAKDEQIKAMQERLEPFEAALVSIRELGKSLPKDLSPRNWHPERLVDGGMAEDGS